MSYQNIAKKANDLRRVQYKNGDKSPRNPHSSANRSKARAKNA